MVKLIIMHFSFVGQSNGYSSGEWDSPSPILPNLPEPALPLLPEPPLPPHHLPGHDPFLLLGEPLPPPPPYSHPSSPILLPATRSFKSCEYGRPPARVRQGTAASTAGHLLG